MVAAEDTRRTGLLLKHFAISKPLLSYFQFNEARRSEEIVERLRRGEKVALTTDAGVLPPSDSPSVCPVPFPQPAVQETTTGADAADAV